MVDGAEVCKWVEALPRHLQSAAWTVWEAGKIQAVAEGLVPTRRQLEPHGFTPRGLAAFMLLAEQMLAAASAAAIRQNE